MSKAKGRTSDKQSPSKEAAKRTYLKQSDVPSASLDEALRVPQTILDHYAGRPTTPLYVAKALNVDPKGSQLKLLSGAAIAFGLIDGGAQAATISVTDLARRILRPTAENADLVARREAVLQPRIFGESLRNYDNNPFPRQDIALNVLEGMGVPRAKTREVFERIEESARSVGFLDRIKEKDYVNLQGAISNTTPENAEEEQHQDVLSNAHVTSPLQVKPKTEVISRVSSLGSTIVDDERRRRVFITHGKNRDLVEPIKKLLEFGEMVPVVSVEKQTVSKPVPEKVMDDMRSCGAAIIHVDTDRKLTDKEGHEHDLLNSNVLIEIGAAMAFYGRRFILLVRDGVKLPSNLQGLYEVRYTNETLDSGATIKLLEAIKDIKNHPLPTDNPGNEVES